MKNLVGKYKRTDKIRRKASLANMGKKSYLKDKTYEEVFGVEKAEIIKLKISKNHADFSGENNPAWLQELKTIRGIHVRIIILYGKANKCENKKCERKSKFYEWSHKTHKYSLDRKEWQKLCRSCHKKYDYKNKINGKCEIKDGRVKCHQK